ncbi:hypothetical protein [Niveispirillum irakense]|uniref:hypothetical protein n=1 Tax=Niveispirillum irakense TaxID=34011 RepID=UPI000409DA72|nr:hypothetical protein [Niveispirillum irakense]
MSSFTPPKPRSAFSLSRLLISGGLALGLFASGAAAQTSCPELSKKYQGPEYVKNRMDMATSPESYERPGSTFPDFGYMVSPSEYYQCWSSQPLFELKTDFPKTKPKELPSFMKIDFKKNPQEYIMAVRDYAFEGNLPNWNPFENKVRNWYHIPWLHPTSPNGGYPPNGGTEGFHGLIKEAPVSPGQLGPHQLGQNGNYSVYAITLINEQAGYTMHQMWKDPLNPDPRATDKRYGGGFPEGTVFAKLLFTDAPKYPDTLPFMENPLTWLAYITPDFWNTAQRQVGEVHLLQMDIAVRDSRASETGWVFGTFVYNGQLNNPNKFYNLVPVGIMWGNDPQDRTNKTNPFPPTETVVNPNLKETIIFASKDLPPQHLGWNGRLNGPADLNTTSCMSCHNAAQYPAITALVPPGAVPDGGVAPPANGGSEEWMKWFQNIPAGTSMDPRAYSTDFSFQVAIALTNFYAAKGAAFNGMWADDYVVGVKEISRGAKD